MTVEELWKKIGLHEPCCVDEEEALEAAKRVKNASKDLARYMKRHLDDLDCMDEYPITLCKRISFDMLLLGAYFEGLEPEDEIPLYTGEDEDDDACDCDDCDAPYSDDCDDCDDCPWNKKEQADAKRKPGKPIVPVGYKVETDGSLGVMPQPCTKNMPQVTVKDWLQKADEEMDEWKEAVLHVSTLKTPVEKLRCASDVDLHRIAEEAADVSTVLASVDEAAGISAYWRSCAQANVNNDNKARGRW